MRRITVLVAVVVACSSLIAEARQASDRFVVLEVLRLNNLERELNESAKNGYRLKRSAVQNARVMALMEKATSDERYEYRISSVFSGSTGRADQEMNQLGAQGFRVVAGTFMVKTGVTIFNVENVVIMEKRTGSTAVFEYRTLTGRISQLPGALEGALAEGWQFLDMVYGQIIVERTK
jgi:hypothetical protein